MHSRTVEVEEALRVESAELARRILETDAAVFVDRVEAASIANEVGMASLRFKALEVRLTEERLESLID